MNANDIKKLQDFKEDIDSLWEQYYSGIHEHTLRFPVHVDGKECILTLYTKGEYAVFLLNREDCSSYVKNNDLGMLIDQYRELTKNQEP